MNKTDLIGIMAAAADIPKAAAGRALDGLLAAIMDAVASKEDVALLGFGTFTHSNRAERTGRNPQTGAKLDIAATTLPKFKAGKTFKETVKVANK